jgi:hypothetical protein
LYRRPDCLERDQSLAGIADPASWLIKAVVAAGLQTGVFAR